VKWHERLLDLVSPATIRERQIGEALCDLRSLLEEAEEAGQHFRPAARLARTALQAIHWL
jgi:hypothetical protein